MHRRIFQRLSGSDAKEGSKGLCLDVRLDHKGVKMVVRCFNVLDHRNVTLVEGDSLEDALIAYMGDKGKGIYRAEVSANVGSEFLDLEK